MQIKMPYSDAITRKYPEAVVIALAREESGKCNPITLGWSMITSIEPPMMAISIGHTRYSHEVIRRAGEFVIAFPSAAMAEDALFFGTHSGRQMDKLAERAAPTSPAAEVDCVLLADAVANFECVLDGQLDTGDHTVFSGRVVAAHANEDDSLGRLYTLAQGYEMGGVETKPSTED